MTWIWQQADWPNFKWNESPLIPKLLKIYRLRGVMAGLRTHSEGHMELEDQLDALLLNAIRSFEIEGEQLDTASMRSSLTRCWNNHKGARLKLHLGWPGFSIP